ncbi:MAG: hypothetical protein KDB25_05175 [Leucobacter sp.]|nr:hypothetical protein [Leucobacter sp.]
MSAISFPIVIALALLIAAAALAFALAARQSRVRGTGDPVIRITMIIAIVWAMFATIGAVFNAVAILDPGSDTSITFPVETFWPELPEGVELEGTGAALNTGGFTQVTGTVAGLDLPTRICWAISQALWWLIPGVIAALIALACRQLRAGSAFAPAVAKATMATAVVVTVGGFAAQVLGDIAGSMAAAEVLQWHGATWGGNDALEALGIEDPLSAWWPKPGMRIELPFWPIAAGLGFAALAAIFRYGAKLQHDQEGLI